MKRFLIVMVLSLSIQVSYPQSIDPLIFSFDKKYGQVEVGGRFAGVEFHQSNPLPSRISFYYPVANSIDVSTDYWKRGDSRPFAVGVKIGNEKKKWIGREGWKYELSPHTVTFHHQDETLSYTFKYEFCLNEPAMVVTMIVKNETAVPQNVSVYTHLLLSLRTCQTYNRIDSAVLRYGSEYQSITAQFNDPGTRKASLFVLNAGETAAKQWMDADHLSASDDGKSTWLDSSIDSDIKGLTGSHTKRGIAAYEYSKMLSPGETMTIVQVIGSSSEEETETTISSLSKNWMSEVQQYHDLVLSQSTQETHFRTSDSVIDRTVQWSKAILTTNAHYLDGQIVPMPCPAEYNFFFTHDLLMTNLGAVNYDPARVKKDLLYIASLAKDSIIPHAYYWRDNGFQTEYCTPSNWNHLWFIEVSASYLRHSLDTAAIRTLYPLIQKSLSEIMTLLGKDHLMYAFRPDWWDLGWKEGPRAYITALSIRAIEDFQFIASMIDRRHNDLLPLEKKSAAMRSALVSLLWDDSLDYLINYNGSDKDLHKYMGSLIAPAYQLLDTVRTQKMIVSAQKDLLAPGVGIRAVMPSDFHKDSVIQYFKIAGNEAGDEYTYINGGVWPHNNAWYALALHSAGKSDEAVSFVKRTMTIDGIANSPNGVPALYEYRYSNESSPRYGEIDKPSFLWAGGFYLYTMYTIAGMTDNVWNLSVAEHRAMFESPVTSSYSFGSLKAMTIAGKGNRLQSFSSGRSNIASLILPLSHHSSIELSAMFGKYSRPYLASANAIVHSAEYSETKKELECSLASFEGHTTSVRIVAANTPLKVIVNGKSMKNVSSVRSADGIKEITFSFTAGPSTDTMVVKW